MYVPACRCVMCVHVYLLFGVLTFSCIRFFNEPFDFPARVCLCARACCVCVCMCVYVCVCVCVCCALYVCVMGLVMCYVLGFLYHSSLWTSLRIWHHHRSARIEKEESAYLSNVYMYLLFLEIVRARARVCVCVCVCVCDVCVCLRASVISPLLLICVSSSLKILLCGLHLCVSC